MKPGNVHRLSDLSGLSLKDNVLAGAAILAVALNPPSLIGSFVHESVKLWVKLGAQGNPALGVSMLIGGLVIASLEELAEPSELCRLASEKALTEGVEGAIELYKAVRLLSPSHLGKYWSHIGLPDAHDPEFERKLREKEAGLGDVLKANASWDLVARELVEGYPLTQRTLTRIEEHASRGVELPCAATAAFLELLAEQPDSLVYRKWGYRAAHRVQAMAREVASRKPFTEDWWRGVVELDIELRRRRWNPGACADIVAAALGLFLYERVVG